MTSLRTSGRRQAASAACAILLGLALATPAALAAGDDHAQRIPMPQTLHEGTTALPPGDVNAEHIPMPKPLYENSTAMLTETEHCKILERRFDETVGSHQNADKIDQAKVLRIDGGKYCGDGNYKLGIHRLREALDHIGVNSTL